MAAHGQPDFVLRGARVAGPCPHALNDTFAALGHGGRRGLVVVPSLSWNDSRVTAVEMEDRAMEALMQSVTR